MTAFYEGATGVTAAVPVTREKLEQTVIIQQLGQSTHETRPQPVKATQRDSFALI